ncbi:hypothetical protein N9K16_00735 [Alphaproteobacteria bacterium]|jgi:hypothetical protein|nr:hypothetical protein [Alphaproteobacteria bacterium]
MSAKLSIFGIAKQSTYLLAFGLALAIPTSNALACACCADAGDRRISTTPIDEYSQSILSSLRFAREASLYLTADEEQTRGINNPNDSFDYFVDVKLNATNWVFEFSDKPGNVGQLSMAAGSLMREFSIDTKPETQTSDDYKPVELYKEFELSGAVSGTGVFDPGYTDLLIGKLIFHGLGNGCSDASQFTNWTLSVTGPETDFRFFGKLTN